MVDRMRPRYTPNGEMAAFQTQSEQQNSTSVVNTNPNQAFGPSAIPQPNVPSQQINCTNVGMKRKSSDSEQHETPLKQPAWLPQQQPEQQRQDLFCEICIVQLNSVSQALQHRQGKIHLNKAKKVEKFRTVRLARNVAPKFYVDGGVERPSPFNVQVQPCLL